MSKEVMNDNELHEYGINLMINYLEKNDYTIMEVNREKESNPQIIAEKGTDMCFILVSTFMYPKKDVKTDKGMIKSIKEACKNYNAKLYEAKVGLALASAMTGKELGIPYKNEDFLVKFNGLKEL